jgi:ABC-type nitrate/sulfonate/bicarbonate transport system substrate-binding protein
MRNRRPAAVAAVLATATAVALALTGCATSSTATPDSTSAGSAEGGTQTVTVGIDIPFHPLYAYLTAKSDEIFADSGYDVEFEVLDATTLVPSFGRGDIDIVTTVPSFQPRIKDQYGIDTQYFYPMARWTPGSELYVAGDSDIQSIEDLAGKKVATPPLATRFGAEQAAVLATTGETIQDYFELTETDAAAQELTLGRADAAFIEAPATAPLIEAGFRPVYNVQEAFEEEFGDPAVLSGGFIASNEFAEANPEVIDLIVQATQDVWSQFQEDPESVLTVASEETGIPVEQLELVSQILNLAEMPDDQKIVSETDVATWSEIFPLLVEAGFLTEEPEDPASMFIVTE